MSASAPATSARRIEQTRRVLLVSTRARGLHAKFGFVPPPHVERFMEITTADPQGAGALPATKLREFIIWGRSLPQPVNYATTRIGGNQHLARELFAMITGVRMTPIPYKGGGDAMAAVMGGHVHPYFDSMASMTPVYRSGEVRPIAVTGGARDPEFTNMQAFAEGGIPGMDIRPWQALLMPAGAPKAAIERMAALTVGTVVTPDFRAAIAKQGLNPMPMDAARFGTFMRAENARDAEIVKRANMRIDPRATAPGGEA